MQIAVVSINHSKTPIEIREKFSFTESIKIEAGNFLLDRSVEELVIVSTCNRSEVYIVSSDIDRGVEDVILMLEEFFKFPNTRDYLIIKKCKEAIVHLYMVAAGLDSIVIGEDQILGQIRDAMKTSMELGFSKKILNRLFMDGLREGKKIRSQIKISEVPLSTSYIGINLIKEELGSLEGKKALIIGAGEISKLSLTYLTEENLDKIYVSNRTHNKLKVFLEDFEGLTPVNYEDRYKILEEVDILITATAAPHIIVRADRVKDLDKPLFILDLALPRDVEDGVRDNKNIRLFDLDSLEKMSSQNLEKRERLSEMAKEIIEEDVEEYMAWLSTIRVDPVLKSLNTRCQEIKKDRMDYIDRKLDLDSRQRKIIEKMLSSALKSLIREPIKTLKTIDEEDIDGYLETVSELFNLEG